MTLTFSNPYGLAPVFQRLSEYSPSFVFPLLLRISVVIISSNIIIRIGMRLKSCQKTLERSAEGYSGAFSNHIIHNPHDHTKDHFIHTLCSTSTKNTNIMDHRENKIDPQDDYDLTKPLTATTGLRQGLTSYGDAHFSLFLRKVFIKAAGYGEDALSRPIIGIINTYSAFNPCHANIPQLLEAVKRGIHLQGGLAIEFPTISIHESFSSPTSMFLRNLMSMDTEEMIKAQPVDAVVAIGGCDKTVPAQLMGAISANKVCLPLVTGPMMPGSSKGVRVGACTDCRSHWAAYRAGEIDMEDIGAVNEELAPTVSTDTCLFGNDFADC
jgi:hypothetical protein